jgi:hypothetical protein
MTHIFSFTLFLSAILVFSVQFMLGKMLLPLLGGAPAVWNTCLVFFQGALLLGYVYAHLQARMLILRKQLVSHLILLTASLVFLPVGLLGGWNPPIEGNPVAWLLVMLSVSVGLPFVLVSATAPLLQSWYALSGAMDSNDPYFLYVASNLGSLVGLLGYPLVLEPYLTLHQQSWAWSAGFSALLICIGSIAALMWNRQIDSAPAEPHPFENVSTLGRLHWLMLAAVPSSLMQSVTTYVTRDIAAVPLLWVVPLAIYIVSFVLVFSRRKIVPHSLMVFLNPISLLGLTVIIFWHFEGNFALLLALNLWVLFNTSMVCHGELVRLRPSTRRLTEFYLWLSLGGVIGGIFNALIAPLVFTQLAEFWITIVLAALLTPTGISSDVERKSWPLDVAYLTLFCLILLGGIWVWQTLQEKQIAYTYRVDIAVVAALFVYAFHKRPGRFGIALGVFLASGLIFEPLLAERLYQSRNFFGVLKVTQKPGFRILTNGTTVHGMQSSLPAQRREPVSYFHRSGPLGDVFETMQRASNGRHIGVIGLGTGAIACYTTPEDHLIFYEIDPDVKRVAENPKLFTYLTDCQAKVDIVLGDGRLSLTKAKDGYFDLIVIDAFTSDSIPMHLLTREAIDLYLSKLAPHGRIAFHVSNKFVSLVPVLEAVSLDTNLVGVQRRHGKLTQEELELGAIGSTWVVLARKRNDLVSISGNSNWVSIESGIEPPRAWTDDYSNLWRFFRLW